MPFGKSLERQNSGANLNESAAPIYQDELALSKFLEEYLDTFTDYVFKQFDQMFTDGKSKQLRDDASSSSKVLRDLIMIMEVDRVALKVYNTLVAMLIHQEREIIQKHLQRQAGHVRESSVSNSNLEMKEHNQKELDFLMLYIKESIKFLLFGFFKRCRIVSQILQNIKKNFQNDSKESIFAEMLSSNLRWVFLTIRTCIEKVDERFNGNNSNLIQQRPEDNMLGINRGRWPIMYDLKPFFNIINYLIDSLEQMSNVRAYQKNSKYYESTLQKLIEKLF